MREIAIEGRFLVKQMTGTERYAYELVRELDNMPIASSIVVVVPDDQPIIQPTDYQNIRVVPFGHCQGPLWLQVDFRRYCRERDALPVCLGNAAPATERNVVALHDVSPRANKSFYDWKFRWYFRANAACTARRALKIITVSEFSKNEIGRYYKKARGKIQVIPDSWQHIQRVDADQTVLERHGLISGQFYFAMSSLSPNKNMKWLAETARLNPQQVVAIAGSVNEDVFGKHDIPQADNVKYLGYVNDEEAKALMQGCKGFLFPTFYEGFGLPPMEALACGAPVAVSDASCMREVYGQTVRYVDPNVPCNDLEALFAQEVQPASLTLDRFSWSRSADALQSLLRSLCALEGQEPFEAIPSPASVFFVSFADRALRKVKRTVGL